jgi:RimJ/RimL family protein N-acetyltransferase
MNIRRLNVGDVESFWKLRLKGLREHPEAFGASYEDAKEMPMEKVKERLSDSDSSFILGAFKETEGLIGMVGFMQETSRKTRHKGIIWGMYVDRSFQGQGIGKQLLISLMKIAITLPELEQINLAVVDRNISAKRLYQSLGFVTYGLELNALKINENTYVNDELMVYKIERGTH